MISSDLCTFSIAQLAAALKAGQVSPVEITRAYLERIAVVDPQLNCYLTVLTDTALQEARQAEEALRQRGPRSPLHGIPLAHKDIVATRGIKTTCGSKVLADAVPTEDATVITRLREAGSILLGKLNMHEFATLVPSEFFGPVQNPWRQGYSPGGSSSGSGAAVAAGLCAASLGTDTGGSIRLPAAMCGIVGCKPTYGRVSLYGVTPLAWSLDHIGPLTRTVEDAALLLQAVAGYDARDPACSELPVPDYLSSLQGEIRGLRLGVPRDFFTDATDPEVEQAFQTAVAVLAGLGAAITEVTLPDLEQTWDLAQTIMNGEANAWHEPYLARQAEDYSPAVRRFLERGKATLAMDYVKAIRAKAVFRRAMLDACASIDALLTPGTLIPAPPLGARSVMIKGREVRLLRAVVSATSPFNLTGQPVLTVPCGMSHNSLPLALQIVGKPFDEATVLRIGYAYEAQTAWHRQHPALPVSPPSA